MSTNIGVNLFMTRLETTPGSVVETNITIINQSQIIDHYTLRIDGLDPTWWTLSVPTFSLFPGDKGEAKLIIRPPKDAEAKAGGYSFRVIATSKADPHDMTSAEALLVLRGYVSCEVDMSPTKVTGSSGTYQITVTNSGNTDAVLVFEGKDAEEGLKYDFSHSKLTVPAGGSARIQLTVKPKKGKHKKLYSFQVLSRVSSEAKTASREIKTLNGQLEYMRKCKFPWWIIPLIIVLIAAAYFALSMLPKLSCEPTTPEVTPYIPEEETPYSPPASIKIELLAPNGGEKFPVGSIQIIEWDTTDPELASRGEVSLEYSVDGGSGWMHIANIRAVPGAYEWGVPDSISENCKVRATIIVGTSSGEIMNQDTSNGSFKIYKVTITPLPSFTIKPLPTLTPHIIPHITP